MKKFQIISDGACDLKDEAAINNNLLVIPFYISFKSDDYLREKVDINIRDFYQQLVDNEGVYPKTSMPSTDDYLTVFEDLAQNGIDIICLCIAKSFSGSYNSAMNAKNMCLENYPNAKITIIDTTLITVLQGLLVKEVCRMKADGLTYEEIVSKVEDIKKTGRIFFTVKGLDYLQHGGRIGKVAAIIGNVLKINPLITFQEGEISSSGITLSRKRALLKIKEMITSYIEKIGAKLSDFIMAVGYGHDIEEGKDFHQKLISFLGVKSDDVHFEQIGATISVHTGPHPLGVGLIKKYDS